LIKAQPESNLQKIYRLINHSVDTIKSNIDKDQIQFNFNSPEDYSILKNKTVIFFTNSDYEIYEKDEKADIKLDYTIDNVKVNYNKTFRDGLFGNYFVEREITLSGSYLITDNRVRNNDSFEYSTKDSVKYDNVKSLESFTLPFTQGELPPEPFWKGILEPVIAVGTAAVTVFLFFSVRSK
jgi:hypothetical protein